MVAGWADDDDGDVAVAVVVVPTEAAVLPGTALAKAVSFGSGSLLVQTAAVRGDPEA